MLIIGTCPTIIKIFSIEKKNFVYIIGFTGGVAEWLNAPVLKTDVGESLPWVRIPPPPPQNQKNYI